MGKDRRKKDAVRKQAAIPSSNGTDSEPKGQREPRVRAQQREVPKNTAAAKDKTADITPTAEEEIKKPEPINTEELFANLKRETDDIKALTAKKFAKRQIFSNWEKYDESLPQPQYDVDIQGADFESLLQGPVSGGGHFQFKSERSWDANVSALSGELFSLDVELLSEGLATIPLYKKLDIPITFLSRDEIENMDCFARTALKQYDNAKKNVKKTGDKKKDAKEITNRLLDMIKESSPAPVDKNSSDDRTFLNFDIDQSETQNEVDESVNEKESYNNSYINDKPEICEKTGLRQTPSPVSKVNEILAEECPNTALKSSTEVSKESFKEIQQNIIPSRKIKKDTLPDRENKKDIILPKEIKNEVTEEVTLVRESGKEDTLPKEIKREKAILIKDSKKESTSKDVSTDMPKQIEQVLPVDSYENVVQEPAVPLGKRSNRRKSKGQSQTSESQNKSEDSITQSVSQSQNKAQVSENQKKQQFMEIQNKSQPLENQIMTQVTENKVESLESHKKVQISGNKVKAQQSKSQPQSKQTKHQQDDDDLDFLLSLKKPVRESQLSGLQPSQVAKPSIEEDDSSISECNLLDFPQKPTEDLEDWLDSMLGD